MLYSVSEAYGFAFRAHARIGQKRKYTGEPYIVHPEKVAALVKLVDHDDDMIAAAYLHDVVEDTGVTFDDLKRFGFNNRIVRLVYWLTDVSTLEDGNRKRRKAIDREHIAMAPPEAQTIKLADLIDNSQSIIEYDPDFARVYLLEKRRLLGVLTEGDHYLWTLAMGLVEYGESRLGLRNLQFDAPLGRSSSKSSAAGKG